MMMGRRGEAVAVPQNHANCALVSGSRVTKVRPVDVNEARG